MIGLLNAYEIESDPNSYQKQYEPLFFKYLEAILSEEKVKSYKVSKNQFPRNIDEADGWIITGSSASVYEDLDWIAPLCQFARDCHAQKKKLLGICFGHQLIAKALGGKVESSDKGWGVGVRSFNVIKNKKWMTPSLKIDCSLIFSHQDQVVKLPEKALHLGADDFCEFQMYSVGDHIFSMQGHPEFTRDYASSRYSARKEKIGVAKYNDAILSLKQKTDELNIGKWIHNFFKDDTCKPLM